LEEGRETKTKRDKDEERQRRRETKTKRDKDEERFLSPQADHFTGVKWKEKASACSVRNDGDGWWAKPKCEEKIAEVGR